MEQIKDMVTLRAFAYDEALRHGAGTDRTFVIAKKIESYILGEAKLPEVYDPDAHLKEFSKILRENTSRPSFSMSWFSPDTVQPQSNEDVLVMCNGDKFPKLGAYMGGGEWEAYDADVTKTTVDGEIEVVAWLPIPEYNGKKL